MIERFLKVVALLGMLVAVALAVRNDIALRHAEEQSQRLKESAVKPSAGRPATWAIDFADLYASTSEAGVGHCVSINEFQIDPADGRRKRVRITGTDWTDDGKRILRVFVEEVTK